MIAGSRASTDNAMGFDGAAFAFIFDFFCRWCDLAAPVRKAYGASLSLAIFRGYGLEEQAIGCCASCEAVSVNTNFDQATTGIPTSTVSLL